MAAKHAISCFDSRLDGWSEESPEKKHARQFSLWHQLQQNLHKYEDEGGKIQKGKYESQSIKQPIRFPLLTNTKSNINLQACRQLQKPKNQPEVFSKKVLPLRMKTLMIYQKADSENNELKSKKSGMKTIQNKEKFRKKVVVKFERVRELGKNCLQFSDEMFFKDSLNIQEKSKSVKLYPILK